MTIHTTLAQCLDQEHYRISPFMTCIMWKKYGTARQATYRNTVRPDRPHTEIRYGQTGHIQKYGTSRQATYRNSVRPDRPHTKNEKLLISDLLVKLQVSIHYIFLSLSPSCSSPILLVLLFSFTKPSSFFFPWFRRR